MRMKTFDLRSRNFVQSVHEGEEEKRNEVARMKTICKGREQSSSWKGTSWRDEEEDLRR